LKIYNEEVNNLILATSMDVEWHCKNFERVPSEEEYINMIKGKTSVLPRMMLRMVDAAYLCNLREKCDIK